MAFRRATIRDIARRAGVSVGTASNVLNGKGCHADGTRDRVLQVAAELHFAPNALIRSLQSGKTNTIGIFTWRIAADMPRQMTMRLLEGLADGVGSLGYDALFYSRHPDEGDIPATLFLDGRVDGLITAPGGLSVEDLAKLAAARLPTVALYQAPLPDGVGSVGVDNIGGIGAAAGHLVELGHRCIAYVGPAYGTDFQERLDGFCRALAEYDLPTFPGQRCILDSYLATVPAACDQLVSAAPRPTAVMAANDEIALALLPELERHGVRVPQDVSLIGFDDVPAASASPGLTTVRQPAETIGHTAARMIDRLIQGEPAAECRAVLPVELVVRGTSAPPCRNALQ